MIVHRPLQHSRQCRYFFFSSRRRHTIWNCDWSSDVCSSDLSSYLILDSNREYESVVRETRTIRYEELQGSRPRPDLRQVCETRRVVTFRNATKPKCWSSRVR